MAKFLSPFLAAALASLFLCGALGAETAASPTPPAPPPPLERDLGEGLAFFRAHELPADLPPAAAKSGPLVLDLRFTAAKDSAANALEAWLKFRATPTTPVFVLINPGTATALRNVFASEKSHPGLLTLGTASTEFTPDIVIPDDDDEEKLAYDALEHGAVLSSLLTENTDKPRMDEAALVRERANLPDSSAATDDSVAADPADKTDPVATPPPPVIDRPLQRAVHLHRALVALKRL